MENTQNITTSTGGGVGRSVNVHPLVVGNMSDHFIRELYNQKMNPTSSSSSSSSFFVVGALFGVNQSGLNVDVCDSFELTLTQSENSQSFDQNHFKQRTELLRAVFPNLEFLGWYMATQRKLSPELDMKFHKSIQEHNENPILIVLDASMLEASLSNRKTGSVALDQDNNELAVFAYESTVQMVNDTPSQKFSQLTLKIEATESERIAVDHIVNKESGGLNSDLGNGGPSIAHYKNIQNAILMLANKVRIIRSYLELMKAGKIAMNFEELRQARSLCDQLPLLVGDSAKIDAEYLSDYKEGLLLTQLAALTVAIKQASIFIDHFSSSTSSNSSNRQRSDSYSP